jgi:hypothetical protein
MLSDILKTLLLAVGAVVIVHRLLLIRSVSQAYKRLSAAVLGGVAAFALLGYTNFLDFHDYAKVGRHVYQYHDIYHYYLGAKYYKELRYDRLYDCTYIALQDIAAEGTAVPDIVSIRSLHNPDESYTAADKAGENRERCLAAMAPARWQAFKQDLKTFLSVGWQTGWWREMLFDLGFNPPPSWAVFATPLANLVPLSSWALELLPWLDMLLVFGLGGYFVARAFSSSHLFGYWLVLGTNWYASYTWTGGSYFRQIWFACLVVAVCLWKMKRIKPAALCFGLAAALRLFPAAFFAGALWPLLFAWRKPTTRRTLLTASLIFGATVLSAVALSLLLYGREGWQQFFAKISKHNNTYFVMHFGFKKFAVFSPSIAGQDFWWVEGLQRFAAWNARMRAIYQDSIVLNTTLQLGVPAAAFYVFRKYPAHFTSVALGGTLLFFFSMPANYYYVFLALLAVVAMRTKERRPTALIAIAVWLSLVALNVMPFASKDWLVFNGYMNRILFGLFAALPVLGYLESSDRAKAWLSRWMVQWEKGG